MNKQIPGLMVAAVVATLISACGGGAKAVVPPQASTPHIVQLADQTTPQDTPTGVLTVQISEQGAPPEQLKLTASASDGALVASDGIVLGGTGAMRTLQITPVPDAKGTALITLTVSDSFGHQTTSSFSLNVNAVTAPFVSTATTAYADPETATPRMVNGFTFTGDVDTDPAAFDAQLQ